MNVLEIGCGEGEISRTLLQASPDIQYNGIEMTEEGVSDCRKFANSKSLQYFVGDITKLFIKESGRLVLEECDVYACYTADTTTSLPTNIKPFEDWMTLTKNVYEKLNANFRLGSFLKSIVQDTLQKEVKTYSFQACFNTTYTKYILSLILQSANISLVKKRYYFRTRYYKFEKRY